MEAEGRIRSVHERFLYDRIDAIWAAASGKNPPIFSTTTREEFCSSHNYGTAGHYLYDKDCRETIPCRHVVFNTRTNECCFVGCERVSKLIHQSIVKPVPQTERKEEQGLFGVLIKGLEELRNISEQIKAEVDHLRK